MNTHSIVKTVPTGVVAITSVCSILTFYLIRLQTLLCLSKHKVDLFYQKYCYTQFEHHSFSIDISTLLP